jgi:hemin uptake protein HemP
MTAPTTISSLRFLVISLAGGRENGWLAGSWPREMGQDVLTPSRPRVQVLLWYLFRITKVKASCHRLKSFKSTEHQLKIALNWIVIHENIKAQFGNMTMNSESGDSKGEIVPSEAVMSSASERRIRVIENRLDSRELFGETREIMIGHGGDVYRLRLTALNKLILTK